MGLRPTNGCTARSVSRTFGSSTGRRSKGVCQEEPSFLEADPHSQHVVQATSKDTRTGSLTCDDDEEGVWPVEQDQG